MNLWKRIKNFIFSNGKQALVIPDALVFNTINTDEMVRQLELINKAKLNGQNNQPSSTSLQQDSVENAIHEEIMNIVRPVLQNYTSQQSAYRDRQISLHPTAIAGKFRAEASQLILQLQLKISQAKSDLYLVKDALTNVERDWTHFKSEWKVSADPIVKFNFTAKCILLGVLIVAEAILNATLIGPHASGGLLEGFGIALIFPIVTLIGCAFVVGTFIRKFNRPGSLFVRTLYLIGTFIFVIPALLTNFLLAYIRQFIDSDGELEVGYTIWLKLFTGEITNLGLVSSLLFTVSTIFFVIAVYDIYKMDHPVPGLLDKFKERNNQHAKYRSKLKGVHDEILNLSSVATEKIGGSHTLFNACQRESANVLNAQIDLWNKLQGYIDHVEVVMNQLLGIYRETNRSFRNTDVPTYFNNRWSFSQFSYRTPIVNSDDASYRQSMIDAQAEINSTQGELSDAFAIIPEIISNIDSIILEARSRS